MSPENLSLPAWLVNCTLQGSIAIVLVFAMAPLVRRLLGAQAAYVLWAIVMLRLLVPWLPSTPLHWGSPSIHAATAPGAFSAAGLEITTSVGPGSPVATAVPVAAPEAKPTPISSPEMPTPARPWLWGAIALSVWLGGLVTILGLALFRGIRAARLVKRAGELRILPGDSALSEALKLATSARIRIRETGELRSPALTGVFRPTILLPLDWRQRLSAPQLRCVLAHELGHFHRGDLLWRWAFLVARAVHWFNPLVWLAERLSRIDQEMACDEWVLRHDRAADPQIYGEALIASAQRLRDRNFAFPVQAGMAESRTGLKRRIHHLGGIRSHGWAAMVTGLLLSAGLLVLTGPARSEAPTGTGDAAGPDLTSHTEILPDAAPTPVPAADSKTNANGKAAPAQPADPKKWTGEVLLESTFVEMPVEMAANVGPGDEPMGVGAIYGPEKFQGFIRSVDQKKGVDLMSAPAVTTKSGSKAVINVIREFRYPTAFAQSADGKSPAYPTSFDVRNLGVTLEATPTLLPSGDIDIALTSEVVAFAGFVNFNGTRAAKPNLDGDALDDTYEPSASGVINQPIFSTRRFRTKITLHDGETVMLGGLKRDDLQSVLPSMGGPKSTVHLERSLFIFVRAISIDQEGHPVHRQPRSASAASATPAGNVIFSGIPVPIGNVVLSGIPVPGKPGFVTSPYAPGAGYVDVRGFSAGAKVKDPYTGQIFLVPAPQGPEPLPDLATPLGKAMQITIPMVEFKDVSLSDAMNILRKKGAEFDKISDVDKRGIDLSLKLVPGHPASKTITAKLKNITLYEALRFIAATNDLTVVAGTEDLSVEQPETGPLLTVKYEAPAFLLPGLQATKPADMRSFLRVHGIDFPPGATANFVPPSTLIMRNTEGEHVMLQKLFLHDLGVDLDVNKGDRSSAHPVSGKPTSVGNPSAPSLGYVDAKGFPKNAEVKDPHPGEMFPAPGSATRKTAEDFELGPVEIHEAVPKDLLESVGARAGLKIFYEPKGSTENRVTLELKSARAADVFGYVATAADLTVTYQDDGVHFTTKVIGPPLTSAARWALILPDTAFKQKPLIEALDVLRALAKISDPGKKGVNIFLKMEKDHRDDQTVTLTLRNSTLGEAISSIARQANLVVEQTPLAITLIPATDPVLK